MVVGRSVGKTRGIKGFAVAVSVASINGRIWRPRKGLHNFLQYGPIRFQFEPLAGISRSVLAHPAVSIAYFAHDEDADKRQDDQYDQANDDPNDGAYVKAVAIISAGILLRGGSRKCARDGIEIVTRPISGDVA